ncbi:amidase [Paenibacillus tarimensis]
MYCVNASLMEAVEAARETEASLREYLALFLTRFGQAEENIHSFIPEQNLKRRILIEAEALMKKFPQLIDRPPLFGVPVGIKDLLHADGFLTRAGSNLPPELLTGEEASIVAKLRSLGGIIAGKTVTEQFAYSGPIPTRNPNNLNHTPGGSSAGSAASVAAGICPLAIGTQTMQSIIAPASFCGVVGYKISYGRIPIDGVILLSPSFDSIGLFTQDMDSMDLAASLVVPDWKPYHSDRKPVLGIPNGIYMSLMDPRVKKTFQDQIEGLQKCGYTVRYADMPWEDSFIAGDAMLRFVQGEMARVHNNWFDRYADLYGAQVHRAIIIGREIDDKELDQYRSGQQEIRNNLEDLKRVEGIDLWVSPAQGGTAPKYGERTGWPGMTAIWSYAGCPSISIPGAAIDGLPLGFQCIGSYGKDEELLYWSKQISLELGAG